MNIGEKMTALSVDRPGLVVGLAALSVVLFGLAVALPTSGRGICPPLTRRLAG